MDDIASWIWVLVPLGAFAMIIAKRWLQMKERQIGVASSETAEKAAQYAARTARLEQRVAVLERILTDRGTVLADEIDKLRDAPLN